MTRYGARGHVEAWGLFEIFGEALVKQAKMALSFGRQGREFLLLTLDDKVYAHGENQAGCLGLGHEATVEKPERSAELSDLGIVTFAWGFGRDGPFVFALTKLGHVYGWGENSFGRISDDSSTSVSSPVLVYDGTVEPAVDIACSRAHIVLRTRNGEILYWYFDNLNDWDDRRDPEPSRAMEHGKPLICRSISCGRFSAFAVLESGEVYACGGEQYFKTSLEWGSYNPLRAAKCFNVRKVEVAGTSLMALTDDGKVYATKSPFDKEDHSEYVYLAHPGPIEDILAHPVGCTAAATTAEGEVLTFRNGKFEPFEYGKDFSMLDVFLITERPETPKPLMVQEGLRHLEVYPSSLSSLREQS